MTMELCNGSCGVDVVPKQFGICRNESKRVYSQWRTCSPSICKRVCWGCLNYCKRGHNASRAMDMHKPFLNVDIMSGASWGCSHIVVVAEHQVV